MDDITFTVDQLREALDGYPGDLPVLICDVRNGMTSSLSCSHYPGIAELETAGEAGDGTALGLDPAQRIMLIYADH